MGIYRKYPGYQGIAHGRKNRAGEVKRAVDDRFVASIRVVSKPDKGKRMQQWSKISGLFKADFIFYKGWNIILPHAQCNGAGLDPE